MSRGKRRRKHHHWGNGKNQPQPKKQTYQTSTVKSTYSYSYCNHWQEPFELVDGKLVYLSAHFDRPSISDLNNGTAPARFITDIGFYLDELWGPANQVLTSPGWTPPFLPESNRKVVIWPWPDHAAPNMGSELKAAAEWLLQRIDAGETVEIGCLGAHGRTGTMVAIMLVLQGMTATEAIRKIHSTYCEKAIESYSQEEYIFDVEWEVFGVSSRDEYTEGFSKPAYKTYTGNQSYSRWNSATQKWESGPGISVATVSKSAATSAQAIIAADQKEIWDEVERRSQVKSIVKDYYDNDWDAADSVAFSTEEDWTQYDQWENQQEKAKAADAICFKGVCNHLDSCNPEEGQIGCLARALETNHAPKSKLVVHEGAINGSGRITHLEGIDCPVCSGEMAKILEADNLRELDATVDPAEGIAYVWKCEECKWMTYTHNPYTLDDPRCINNGSYIECPRCAGIMEEVEGF